MKLALGRADRRAGVVGRLAVELNRIAQLGRLLRLAQFDEKLRSLVFLHAKVHLAMRPHGGCNLEVAGQASLGRGKTAGKGTVAVGLEVQSLDLLAVGIAQPYGNLPIGHDVVVALALMPRQRNAFEFNGLAGAVNRAVGKKQGHLLRFGLIYLAAPVIVSSCRADPPFVVLC